MKYKPIRKNRIVLKTVFFLVITLLGIRILWVGYGQQRIANDLEQLGVVTQGTVLNKRTSTSTSGGGGPGGNSTTTTHYHVTYRFEANGLPVTREVQNSKIYYDIANGGPVTIRYLAKNPSVNEVEGSRSYQHRATGNKSIGTFIMMIVIIAGLLQLPAWLKWRTFQSSPKRRTQATIIDRRVKSNSSGKGGTTYTYYITYRFNSPEREKTFTFEEEVNEELYNKMTIDTSLAVEYVIAKPMIARRCNIV